MGGFPPFPHQLWFIIEVIKNFLSVRSLKGAFRNWLHEIQIFVKFFLRFGHTKISWFWARVTLSLRPTMFRSVRLSLCMLNFQGAYIRIWPECWLCGKPWTIEETTGRLGRHVEHIIPGGDCFRGSTLKLYTNWLPDYFPKNLRTLKDLLHRCSENHPPRKPLLEVRSFEDFGQQTSTSLRKKNVDFSLSSNRIQTYVPRSWVRLLPHMLIQKYAPSKLRIILPSFCCFHLFTPQKKLYKTLEI